MYVHCMARPLRIAYEGAVYHITSRGNGGEIVFFEDGDRTGLLRLLKDVVSRFGWICHAYCLMPNHYHLLVETPDANLSRGMRHLNGVYTQWVNRNHHRAGHLFQGRFQSIVVEKQSHLLEVSRYIVLNPVRAGMTDDPSEWRWSSYRATVGLEVPPSFLTVGWILEQFDDDPARAVLAYRRFVFAGMEESLWDKLSNGCLLGSARFAQALSPLLKTQRAATEIPRRQRLADRPSLEELLGSADDKRSRDVGIHRAVRVYQYTLREVADYVGLHYSTVSHVAASVARELGSGLGSRIESDRGNPRSKT